MSTAAPAAVLVGATALVFLKAGLEMVLALGDMPATAERLGLTLRTFRAVGALELAGAAGLVAGSWWSPLGVAAAAGLAALTVGATLAHRRAGDPAGAVAPALGCCLLAVASAVALLS